jgi:hypothetical protein
VPKTLQYLAASYQAMLWLYPSELRDAYGQDMANVFEQILKSEWTKRGPRGVATAACRAVGELFTVAIPMRLMSDRMIAAGLSLVITSGVLALLVGIMMWPRYRFR